jgi:hypothetical protein
LENEEKWNNKQIAKTTMLTAAHRAVFSGRYTLTQVKDCWKGMEKKYKEMHQKHKVQTGAGLTDEQRQAGVIDNQDDFLNHEWRFWRQMDRLVGKSIVIKPPGKTHL